MSAATGSPTPFPMALRFGASTGLLMIAVSWLTTEYSARNQVVLPFYVEFVFVALLLVGLTLSMLAYRRSFGDVMMRYPEALGCGILTSFFMAMLLAIFTYAFFSLNESIRISLIELQKSHANPEELKLIEENLHAGNQNIMFTFLALSTFLKYLIYGILGSLIIPLFMIKIPQKA